MVTQCDKCHTYEACGVMWKARLRCLFFQWAVIVESICLFILQAFPECHMPGKILDPVT